MRTFLERGGGISPSLRAFSGKQDTGIPQKMRQINEAGALSDAT
jgi:hypothetical protein